MQGKKVIDRPVNRQDLAYAMGYLIGLPKHGRRGTSMKIVNVIFKAISDALQRGEEVKIQGFGIFRPYTYKARKTLFYYHQFKNPDGTPLREFRVIPARTHTKFIPSKALIKFLDTPLES